MHLVGDTQPHLVPCQESYWQGERTLIRCKEIPRFLWVWCGKITTNSIRDGNHVCLSQWGAIEFMKYLSTGLNQGLCYHSEWGITLHEILSFLLPQSEWRCPSPMQSLSDVFNRTQGVLVFRRVTDNMWRSPYKKDLSRSNLVITCQTL